MGYSATANTSQLTQILAVGNILIWVCLGSSQAALVHPEGRAEVLGQSKRTCLNLNQLRDLGQVALPC